MPVQESTDRTRAVLGAQSPRSFIAGFDYSILLYSGCAFGCSYCYVPAVIGRGAAGRELATTWGTWLKARPLTPAVIRARAADLAGKALFLSATTDPYQPAERRYGLTRAVLEALASTAFRRLLISTRNPMLALARDLDLLASPELAGRVEFGVSLTTDREDIRARFERHNPPAVARRDAARALRAAGLTTRLHVAPLLPNSGAVSFAAWLAAAAPHYVWFDDLNHVAPALRAQFADADLATWLDPAAPDGQEAALRTTLAALAPTWIAVDRGSAGFVRGWDPTRHALVAPAVWGTPLTPAEADHAAL